MPRRKIAGTARGYKRTSKMLTAKKPRKVRLVSKKKKKKKGYKIPKTPKVSGRGWGG